MRNCAAVILFTVALSGCESPPTADLSDRSGGRQLRATVGADVTIRLASNPTTGYSWRLTETPPAFLELVNSEFVPRSGGGGRLGAGGVQVFTLRATAAGRADLVFEYVRPWEKGRPPIDTRDFSVVVE